MSKKSSSDNQQTIFDFIKRVERVTRQSGPVPEGSLDIIKEFKAAMAEDIRHAVDEHGKYLSRFDVAAKMSNTLGKQITKDKLDNWTAQSHDHMMPAPYLPAFKQATGGRRAHETIAKHSGLFLLLSQDALYAEYQKLDEKAKQIRESKRELRILMKKMEGAGS